MKLYTPALECSGGGTNISRDVLRRQKERLIATLSPVRQFEIHDLRVRLMDNGAAVAEFRVDWVAAQNRVASTWYRLLVRRIQGHWAIYCEEQSEIVSQRQNR